MTEERAKTVVTPNWLQGNDLLRRLNRESMQRLSPKLKLVQVEQHEVLYKPGQRISDIYFPDTAVLCMLTTMQDGRTIEALTVGNEGASWISASMGAPTMPCQTMAVISGRVCKIAVNHVEEEIRQNGIFHDLVSEYAHALLISSMRTGACNGLHSLTQRTARWMLMTVDRTSIERFCVTQEFLASLLGCNRPTLNTILGELEHAGAIHAKRGSIEVKDRAVLTKHSCECYRVIRKTFEELVSRENQLLARESARGAEPRT